MVVTYHNVFFNLLIYVIILQIKDCLNAPTEWVIQEHVVTHMQSNHQKH